MLSRIIDHFLTDFPPLLEKIQDIIFRKSNHSLQFVVGNETPFSPSDTVTAALFDDRDLEDTVKRLDMKVSDLRSCDIILLLVCSDT